MKLLSSNCLGDCSYSFQGSSELISIAVAVSLFSCRTQLQERIPLGNSQEFSAITVTCSNGFRIENVMISKAWTMMVQLKQTCDATSLSCLCCRASLCQSAKGIVDVASRDSRDEGRSCRRRPFEISYSYSVFVLLGGLGGGWLPVVCLGWSLRRQSSRFLHANLQSNPTNFIVRNGQQLQTVWQEKRALPQTFGSGYLRVGWGSSTWTGGAKKFGMSFETQGCQTFGRDIRDFCWDVLGARKVWEKKVCVEVLALDWRGGVIVIAMLRCTHWSQSQFEMERRF